MARRRYGRRDWRMVVFLVMSLIIVLSMVFALFIQALAPAG